MADDVHDEIVVVIIDDCSGWWFWWILTVPGLSLHGRAGLSTQAIGWRGRVCRGKIWLLIQIFRQKKIFERYARFVDIKISEYSGDTQVSSREDIEEGACRSVESSKLIFFSEIHFYQKFKMHSSRSLILELRTKKLTNIWNRWQRKICNFLYRC